jgi:hypothetical protein
MIPLVFNPLQRCFYLSSTYNLLRFHLQRSKVGRSKLGFIRKRRQEMIPKEGTMIRRFQNVAIAVLWLVVRGNPANGQTPPPSTVTIDVANVVEYLGDIYDPTKFGTSPGVTPANGANIFSAEMAIGDIVSVNGQPASGLYVGRPLWLASTPTPTPRQAIGDTGHASLRSHTFEILKSDGTVVGTIMCFGLDAGPPPPGAPSYGVDTRGDVTLQIIWRKTLHAIWRKPSASGHA